MVDQGLSGNLLEDFGDQHNLLQHGQELILTMSIQMEMVFLMDGRQMVIAWCTHKVESILNGSDYLNNPDGDGFDVNFDGILSQDEEFNSGLNITSDILKQAMRLHSVITHCLMASIQAYLMISPLMGTQPSNLCKCRRNSSRLVSVSIDWCCRSTES